MKKVAIILADGFEEVEMLTPFDYLTRAGAEITIFGVNKKTIISRNKLTIQTNDIIENFKDQNSWNEFDMLFIPGGLHFDNLEKELKTIKDLKESFIPKLLSFYLNDKNKVLAAICAAPLFLQRNISIGNLKYTAFEIFNDNKENFTNEGITVDQNLITGKSVHFSEAFAFECVKALFGQEGLDKLLKDIKAI